MIVPRVSVIIATYNWSEALACALRSVRLQTFTDYEVLVMGDACTDDSESVVASMNDPRFRWFNRDTNAGSQWGPNNDGIARSNAEYIAYLGHDDLWHPTHLESLVRLADERSADIACSVAVMYGSEESGVRAVSGIFTDGEMDERQFFVPSSMLHRRSLIERIGPWRPPAEAGLPTDCDFVLRAFRAGALFAASNELTVFKFNAAWRRDAYGRRATHEQRALLARIESGTDFRPQELVGVIRAMLSRRNIEVRMPLPGEATSRAMTQTRIYKGASAAAAAHPLLEAPCRFLLDDQPPSLEWYPPEHDPTFGSFRWSGPSTAATLQFPVRAVRGSTVDLHILALASPSTLSALTLEIDGRPAPFSIKPAPEKSQLLHAAIEHDTEPNRPLSIRIRLPCNTPRAVDPDRRPRAIALAAVLLTPPGQSPLPIIPAPAGWKSRMTWPWARRSATPPIPS